MAEIPERMDDDKLLRLAAQCFGPGRDGKLFTVKWKDGIDIDVPTPALRKFCDTLTSAAEARIRELEQGGGAIVEQWMRQVGELQAQLQAVTQERDTVRNSLAHEEMERDIARAQLQAVTQEAHGVSESLFAAEAKLAQVTRERDQYRRSLAEIGAYGGWAQMQERIRELETKNEILEDKLLAARKP